MEEGRHWLFNAPLDGRYDNHGIERWPIKPIAQSTHHEARTPMMFPNVALNRAALAFPLPDDVRT